MHLEYLLYSIILILLSILLVLTEILFFQLIGYVGISGSAILLGIAFSEK